MVSVLCRLSVVLELQDLGDLVADTQPSALTGTKPKHLSVFVAACSGQPLQVTPLPLSSTHRLRAACSSRGMIHYAIL